MVDVRDMLCAQALAVVAKALEATTGEEVLDILYNAEDVKRDLLVWANDRGYRAHEAKAGVLRVELPCPTS